MPLDTRRLPVPEDSRSPYTLEEQGDMEARELVSPAA